MIISPRPGRLAVGGLVGKNAHAEGRIGEGMGLPKEKGNGVLVPGYPGQRGPGGGGLLRLAETRDFLKGGG